MISPRVAAEGRRTENGDWSGGRGSRPGSVVIFDTRIPGGGASTIAAPPGGGGGG